MWLKPTDRSPEGFKELNIILKLIPTKCFQIDITGSYLEWITRWHSPYAELEIETKINSYPTARLDLCDKSKIFELVA